MLCSYRVKTRDWPGSVESRRMSLVETPATKNVGIQARAIRRCGELLKAIHPNKGGRPSGDKTYALGDTSSRSQVARDAGLSPGQRVTALRAPVKRCIMLRRCINRLLSLPSRP